VSVLRRSAAGFAKDKLLLEKKAKKLQAEKDKKVCASGWGWSLTRFRSFDISASARLTAASTVDLGGWAGYVTHIHVSQPDRQPRAVICSRDPAL
jgi:hypothetical protein